MKNYSRIKFHLQTLLQLHKNWDCWVKGQFGLWEGVSFQYNAEKSFYFKTKEDLEKHIQRTKYNIKRKYIK